MGDDCVTTTYTSVMIIIKIFISFCFIISYFKIMRDKEIWMGKLGVQKRWNWQCLLYHLRIWERKLNVLKNNSCLYMMWNRKIEWKIFHVLSVARHIQFCESTLRETLISSPVLLLFLLLCWWWLFVLNVWVGCEFLLFYKRRF